MEKSNPPGCNFCPPLIGALKWAPHSISLTAYRDPHLKQRHFTSKKGPKWTNLPLILCGNCEPRRSMFWGWAWWQIFVSLQTISWELKIYEGRWPQAWRWSLYFCAREPLTFSTEKLLPHIVRSSLCHWHHGAYLLFIRRVSAILSKLPSSALNTFMSQPHLSSHLWFLSGTLVKFPFILSFLKASHYSSSPATTQTLSSLPRPSVIVVLFPGGWHGGYPHRSLCWRRWPR